MLYSETPSQGKWENVFYVYISLQCVSSEQIKVVWLRIWARCCALDEIELHR